MSLVRYKINPFLNDFKINTKDKQIKISCLGSDDNILVNQSTGETYGTHVSTYKKVDNDKFVKLFTQNIALTFDLTSAGIKAFNVLMFAVQKQAIEKDIIALDSFTLDDFISQSYSLKLSLATFKRGVSELVKSKIIAHQSRKGFYFINPNFVFNGDRIAFTTVISRNRKEESN